MVYTEAPWVFKGRALYQLQLVKSEEARKYIPNEFKLVELFGYTLGGFYLARYDDSPVGAFEELVALAGLVWNAPTSCAWAARVYVNDREARDHGLRSVGLPSRLAQFEEPSSSASSSSEAGPLAKRTVGMRKSAFPSWWHQQRKQQPATGQAAQSPAVASTSGDFDVRIMNVDPSRGRCAPLPVCSLQLPPALKPSAFAGPRIRMALPSFSGATALHPGLLEYSCDLMTNVMPVAPARVILPSASETRGEQDTGDVLTAVLGGTPLVALAFNDMEMTVEEPTVLTLPSQDTSAPNPWERRPNAGLRALWASIGQRV